MFDVLLASGAHAALRPRWVTASVLTHTVLITLAVSIATGALAGVLPARRAAQLDPADALR